ncbi:hypothetical protein ACWGA0_30620 [Streptomyces erythrochromogenes]
MTDVQPDAIPAKPQKAPRPPRNPWKTAALCLAVALAATSGGLIYTLASDQGVSAPEAPVSVRQDTRTPVSPDGDAPSASPSPPPSATGSGVGTEVRSGGAYVTVSKVTRADSIKQNDRGETVTVKAGDGAVFIVLDTVVRNETKASMDLTCGYPVANSLIDGQGRRYDAIKDLYKLPGNPECNDQLQPGFKNGMQYVYRVPVGARIVSWKFQEVDFSAVEEAPAGLVQLGEAGAQGASS